MGTGLGFAAQLEGLYLQPAGDKVQVILEMPAEKQAYQTQRFGPDRYRITLPQATLPPAFQGSAMPPISHPKTGMMAQIHESAEGLYIDIQAPQKTMQPVEVIFKTGTSTAALPKPQSPMALLSPAPQEAKGLFQKLQKHPAITKAPASKAVVKTSAPLTKRVVPKRLVTVKPASSVQPMPEKPTKPAVVQASQASPFKIQSDVSKPQALQNQPEALKVGAEEEIGYNLLEQALKSPVSPQKSLEESSPFEDTDLTPYRVEDMKPLTPPAPKRENAMQRALGQWLFVAMALLGGLILIAALLGLWLKRRWQKTRPAIEQSATQAPGSSQAVSEETGSPLPKPAVSFQDHLEIRRPSPFQTSQTTRSEGIFPVQSSTSVSEAVNSVFASRRSPYVTRPFQISPSSESTASDFSPPKQQPGNA